MDVWITLYDGEYNLVFTVVDSHVSIVIVNMDIFQELPLLILKQHLT